ncbi:histone H3-like 5 [Trichinella patagoniensis]|uniref:Histone H3-like 5 n=1 Tax=Trichinella patagoniensis TaxID=990121 RepID=A0A0V0YSI8_9BILA|nr:histone H3-like 5 [Trichinella patagoniensis]
MARKKITARMYTAGKAPLKQLQVKNETCSSPATGGVKEAPLFLYRNRGSKRDQEIPKEHEVSHPQDSISEVVREIAQDLKTDLCGETA